MKAFFRCCAALLSACVFVWLLSSFTLLLWQLTPCAFAWETSCEAAREKFFAVLPTTHLVAGLLWIGAWMWLEAKQLRNCAYGSRPGKLLTHLRYGPLLTLLFAAVTIFSSDALLIQYSRYQIIRYIHSDAPPDERPSLDLHNDYRGWCGNGMTAREYWLYGETPAAEFDNSDPSVRARALQAGIDAYDWLNQPSDGPLFEMLLQAESDPDSQVRAIAAECRAELFPQPSAN